MLAHGRAIISRMSNQRAWEQGVRNTITNLMRTTKGEVVVFADCVEARDEAVRILGEIVAVGAPGAEGRSVHVLAPEPGYSPLVRGSIEAACVLNVRPGE
jgi:hypothetical protein